MGLTMLSRLIFILVGAFQGIVPKGTWMELRKSLEALVIVLKFRVCLLYPGEKI